MTQPPVRYENYPPENDPGEAASGAGDPHPPVIRPYVPATIPSPPARGGSSRRLLIGWVIAIPVVGIVLISMARANDGTNNDDPDDGDPGDPNYTDDSDDPEPDEEFSVGDHSSTAPAGWTVHDDGSGTVQVAMAGNRLTAVNIETATSTLAVEEIAHLSKKHYIGFTGKIGEPVDRSTADLQHATMDGAGKFQGLAARLLSELWIDDTGSGLLVVRLLTAKASSTIDVQAREMVNELGGDF